MFVMDLAVKGIEVDLERIFTHFSTSIQRDLVIESSDLELPVRGVMPVWCVGERLAFSSMG